MPDGSWNFISRKNGYNMYVLMILMELNFSWKVYLRKENSSGSLSEGVLLAVGGRYDYLLQQLWRSDYVGYAYKFNLFWLPLAWLVSFILFFPLCISLTVENASRMFKIMYIYINHYLIWLLFAWITNFVIIDNHA